MEALRREIQFHRENVFAYRLLAQAEDLHRKPDEAIDTLRAGLKVAPGDTDMAARLSTLLSKQKRYEEIPAILQPAIEKSDNPSLQGALAQALLRSGHRDEGKAALEKYIKSSDDMALNNAAYYLADTDLGLAKEYAIKAVSRLEEKSTAMALPSPKEADLRLMNSLCAAWDTLGWVYFHTGDLTMAEKYVSAAWELSQRGEVGDHLGQIYLKQGKKQSATNIWLLALASDGSLDETRQRLQASGASSVLAPQLSRAGAKVFVPPSEELSKLRMTKVPGLPKQEASAEFFLLFSSGMIENTQFITGSESLKQSGAVLKKTDFHVPMPDQNGEKLLRRGILSCSTYTVPSCEFVMLLPSTSQTALLAQSVIH